MTGAPERVFPSARMSSSDQRKHVAWLGLKKSFDLDEATSTSPGLFSCGARREERAAEARIMTLYRKRKGRNKDDQVGENRSCSEQARLYRYLQIYVPSMARPFPGGATEYSTRPFTFSSSFGYIWSKTSTIVPQNHVANPSVPPIAQYG